MNDFLLLKLNRAIWVALLEQQKILEGINYFECYCNDIASIKNRKNKIDVDMELQVSRQFFLVIMKKLAQEFYDAKNYSNAIICYTSIFKLDRNDTDIIKNYISCLNHLHMYDLEIDLLTCLEEKSQDNYEVFKILSDTYAKQNNYKFAIEYYEKYMRSKPQSTINSFDYNQLGCYYNTYYSDTTHELNDALKSLECFEKASELEPFARLGHKNATIMATRANEFEISKKHWDKLLELNVLNNDDKYDYAAFCLRTKDFAGWHKYYDSRFEKEHNKTFYPVIKKPRWDGKKKIKKSTLLVHCEQGFGDTFLVWGHIPKLTQYAKRVIFVVQDPIYDLIKNNNYGVEVVAKSNINLNTLEFDYHIPSMSVPIALKLAEEQLCVGGGYIKADPKLTEELKEKYFNNNKLKIGVAFSGIASGNKTRNISIEQLLPLDKMKNVEFYSLTKEVSDKELEIFKNNKIHNLAHEFINFSHTAAAIENCDVIISTDNCILNLAGAMGKKTFGLFNFHFDFRWYDLTGEDSGWYTSVKPYVNKVMDNWSPSLEKIMTEINQIQKNSLLITLTK